MKKVILVCAVLSLLSTGLAVETVAEVRVRTGPDGEYDSTVIVPGGPPWGQGIWGTRTRTSLRRGSAVLNPLGDRFGDLIPTVSEHSQIPHHPWAVWSRFNGNDYDLVYSSWTYQWSGISPVTQQALDGDDLNPDVAFTYAGQPLIAWWNQNLEDGHGTVYYTVLTGAGWLEPVKISHDSVGGRRPTIEVGIETIVIHYDSDDGSLRISHELAAFDPTTITDDIDPQTSLTPGNDNYGSPKGVKDKH